ncbi:hypothetical protein EJ04DRAFT_509086 [Polyplosphaeria fusca]|uniref:C2H2-type domain-containing protein n=1 Tax=Polyplosphaeria fusca TaxID=682080 RepID=A0A9P4R8T0_9PLEO|nr:hypothetical protein EJ04DRAFT_509086 [Polyplosphaeria fusca]
MPPATERRQSLLNLECEVCHRQYSKKEHLQRHERTHTGIRPFSCPVCGRSFARQDALNRHGRVHGHRNNSAHAPESTVFLQTDLNVMASNGQNPSIDAAQHLSPTDPYCNGNMSNLNANNPFVQGQLQNSSLFWPDSEHLLQNIMSIDPALWEQPLAFLPPILDSQTSPGTTDLEDGVGSSAGEGQRAIQTLSALISNTVNMQWFFNLLYHANRFRFMG